LVAAGAIAGPQLMGLFEQAENLTDRLAALRLLVHQRLDGSEAALALFRERFGRDPLVVDKWFAVQATAPEHGTLGQVRSLSADPSFSWTNPNRVYALIRSFATANPVGFNRPDGASYHYVAQVVRELDAQNPSVAARLATAFRSFRMLEPERRAHAEEALRQISQTDRLSRDVSDIVARTLEG
jgi:aminopeptidase N